MYYGLQQQNLSPAKNQVDGSGPAQPVPAHASPLRSRASFTAAAVNGCVL